MLAVLGWASVAFACLVLAIVPGVLIFRTWLDRRARWRELAVTVEAVRARQHRT